MPTLFNQRTLIRHQNINEVNQHLLLKSIDLEDRINQLEICFPELEKLIHLVCIFVQAVICEEVEKAIQKLFKMNCPWLLAFEIELVVGIEHVHCLVEQASIDVPNIVIVVQAHPFNGHLWSELVEESIGAFREKVEESIDIGAKLEQIFALYIIEDP